MKLVGKINVKVKSEDVLVIVISFTKFSYKAEYRLSSRLVLRVSSC